MTIRPTIGRPIIKPNRKPSTVLINTDLPDRLQRLQLKRGEGSVSDLINEGIILLLKQEGQ
jgi:predicted CopG family antitoxin